MDKTLVLRDGVPYAVDPWPPIGVGLPYFGGELPDNYFFCDGSDKTADNCPLLARVIGAVYGFGTAEAYTYQTYAASSLIETSSAHGRSVGDIIFLQNGDDFSGGYIDGGSGNGRSLKTRPFWVTEVPTTTRLRITNNPDGGSDLTATTSASGLSFYRQMKLPHGSERVFLGREAMDPTNPANLISGFDSHVLGEKFGEATHLLTGQESGVQNHTHPYVDRYDQGTDADGTGGKARNNDIVNANKTTSGSGDIDAVEPHNNLQPVIVCNYIIRYQ